MAIVNYNNTYNPYSRTLYSGSTLSAGSCGSLSSVGYIGSLGSLYNTGSAGNAGSFGSVSSSGSMMPNISNSLSANEMIIFNKFVNSGMNEDKVSLVFDKLADFMDGKISAQYAVRRLKFYGIHAIQINAQDSPTIKFTYRNKTYTFTSYKSNDNQANPQMYSSSELQSYGKLNFSDSMLNEYFNLVYEDSDGTKMYTFKTDCGYNSPEELSEALFNKYKEDLILDNFLNNKNRETDTSATQFWRVGNRTIRQENYASYIEKIGLAEGEDAKKLRAEALDKLVVDFTSGNLTTDQAIMLLNTIGVTEQNLNETQNGMFELSFKYDNKSYILRCNKAAAERSTDGVQQQTYTYSELQNMLGGSELDKNLLNEYFIQSVEVNSTIASYSLKEGKNIETFISASEKQQSTSNSNIAENWQDFLDNGNYDKLIKYYADPNSITPDEIVSIYKDLNNILNSGNLNDDEQQSLLLENKRTLQSLVYKTLTGKTWNKDENTFARGICLYYNDEQFAYTIMCGMDDIFHMSDSQKEILMKYIQNPTETDDLYNLYDKIADILDATQDNSGNIQDTDYIKEVFTAAYPNDNNSDFLCRDLYEIYNQQYGIDQETFRQIYQLAGDYAINSGSELGSFENCQEFLNSLDALVAQDVSQLRTMSDDLLVRLENEIEGSEKYNKLYNLYTKIEQGLEGITLLIVPEDPVYTEKFANEMSNSDLAFTYDNFIEIYKKVLGINSLTLNDISAASLIFAKFAEQIITSDDEDIIIEQLNELSKQSFKNIIKEISSRNTFQTVNVNVNRRMLSSTETVQTKRNNSNSLKDKTPTEIINIYNKHAFTDFTAEERKIISEAYRQKANELRTSGILNAIESDFREIFNVEVPPEDMWFSPDDDSSLPLLGSFKSMGINCMEIEADYLDGKITLQERNMGVRAETLAATASSVYSYGKIGVQALKTGLLKFATLIVRSGQKARNQIFGFMFMLAMGADKAEELITKYGFNKIYEFYKKSGAAAFVDNLVNGTIENGIRSLFKEEGGTNVGDQVEGHTQGSGASNKGGSGNTPGTGTGSGSTGNTDAALKPQSGSGSWDNTIVSRPTSGSVTHSGDTYDTTVSWSGSWVYDISKEYDIAKECKIPQLNVIASKPVMLKEFESECRKAGLDYDEAEQLRKRIKESYDPQTATALINGIAVGKYIITGKEEIYAGSNECIVTLEEKSQEQLEKEIQEIEQELKKKEQELKRSQREAEMRDLFNGDYDTYLKEIYGIESDDGLTFEKMTGQPFPTTTQIQQTTPSTSTSNKKIPMVIDFSTGEPEKSPICASAVGNFYAQLQYYYGDDAITMSNSEKFKLFLKFCQTSGIRIEPVPHVIDYEEYGDELFGRPRTSYSLDEQLKAQRKAEIDTALAEGRITQEIYEQLIEFYC